ncbi:CDP-glucose 4,6-dehydratase [uncultured Hoeflea sp.]|uniref:CDP-glucose 4,6-dehydratase n=1 Tax=uncultured Hoeflea sp. TaxID=538666 RepID=UPI002620465E|nr:CDP-glucose 4,6-dehydratase [uncultured Hoeflea sp.]
MREFWRNRRVLVTGHTGFKGSWLSLWLSEMGAQVHGLALVPDTDPSLFDSLGLSSRLDHVIGDIRDADVVARRVNAVKPEIVFHLAAQPLVLRSYAAPVETWQTNVGGTLHLLDALRETGDPATLIVVTTDKIYENREWQHPYRESDRLGGHDLYSASKAATEMLVASWRDSYANENRLRIATARAGNVIGGGDFAENRILPDIVRALQGSQSIEVRNPASVRPWQHVLDPLSGYLELAARLHADISHARAYNFGPAAGDFRTVGDLVAEALTLWPGAWRDMSDPSAPHEAGLLSVASDMARLHLDWSPRWPFETAVARTMSWYRGVDQGASALDLSLAQIAEFEAG